MNKNVREISIGTNMMQEYLEAEGKGDADHDDPEYQPGIEEDAIALVNSILHYVHSKGVSAEYIATNAYAQFLKRTR